MDAARLRRRSVAKRSGADAPHPGYSFVLCILAWLMHLLACAACLHMRRSGGALAAAGHSGKPQLMNGDHQDAYMALGDDDDGKGRPSRC